MRPIHPFARALALAALAVLVVACSSGGGASSAPSEGGAADPLTGTTWILVSIDDVAVAAGLEGTLAFDAGAASGSSGCNTFSGTYTLSGQDLAFGPLATTRMACVDEAASAFEAAYLVALEGVTAWAVPQDVAMGTELTLTGSAKLVFGPPAG